MNRVSIRTSAGYEDYLLKEDEKTVLKLRFNSYLNTARIETEKEKRVFLIEDEGLLRTRLILKNEYGVRIGQLVPDNWHEHQGAVEMESQHFRFTIGKKEAEEVLIYNRGKLIYACNLLFDPVNNPRFPAKNFPSLLILALSWYLLQQSIIQKEHEMSL